MSTTVEYILEVETKGAQKALDKTNQKIQKTSKSMKKMRSTARGLSGSMQAVGEVSSFVAPELVGLGEIAILGARSFRAFGRALASGNAIIIGITVAVSAAVAVYSLWNAANEENKKSLEATSKALEENTKKIKENHAAFVAAEESILASAGKVNDLRLQYMQLTGAVSENEAAEAQRVFAAEQFASKLEASLEKQIGAKKEEVNLDQDSLKAINRRIDLLVSQNKIQKVGGDLTKDAADLFQKQAAAEKKIKQTLGDIVNLRQEGTKRIQEQSAEFAKLQEQIAKALEEQEKKEEAIKRAKERQAQLQNILNGLHGAALSLSQKLLSSQISRMSPMDRIDAEYRKEIDNLDQIQSKIEAEAVEAERVARSKKDQVKLTEIQKAKTEALAVVEKLRTDALIAKNSKITKQNAKDARDQKKKADDAKKEADKAAEERIDAQRRLGDIIQTAGSDQLSAIDKINQKEKELLDTLIAIGKQYGFNTDAAQKAVKDRAARDRAAQQAGGVGGDEGAARADRDRAIADGIASGIEALGSASSLLALGGSGGGILSALSDLGQKTPEEIKQEYEATFQGIAAGIKMLPALLFDVLPPILFEAAGMIIDAIIQLPFAIIAGVIKGVMKLWDNIVSYFSDGFWKGIAKFFTDLWTNLVDLITSPFEGLFDDSKMGGGRMLSAQGGLRFTGANQGLAMLHQGEMVVPRSGQMSSTVARDVQNHIGGGGVTININSAVTERSAIDALVRKIEDRFGSFGQSTSPLFGGL